LKENYEKYGLNRNGKLILKDTQMYKPILDLCEDDILVTENLDRHKQKYYTITNLKNNGHTHCTCTRIVKEILDCFHKMENRENVNFNYLIIDSAKRLL
jgi:hypothetical protein